MAMEIVLVSMVAIAVGIVMLQLKMPLVQIFVGFIACLMAFLAGTELPLFPWSNLLIAVIGVGDILAGVVGVR